MSAAVLGAALLYRGDGLSVFPVCWTDSEGRCLAPGETHGASCPHPGKHPLVPWKPYQERLPSEGEVRQWWRRWPQANIGFATGKVSGRFVLDLDGEAGRESLQELEARFGSLPSTQVVLTPNGVHYHFAHPSFHVSNTAGAIGAGVDIRGDGGYAVLPPSSNGGREYRWEATGHPRDVDLAPAPPWLLDMLQGEAALPQAGPSSSGHNPGWVADALGHMEPGDRNDTLTRVAGKLRRDGWSTGDIAALLRPHAEAVGLPLAELGSIARSVERYQAILSAAIRDRVAAERIFNFRTAREVGEETPAMVEWLAEPYLVKGSITEVDGKIKSAGKSTWVTHLCRHVLEGTLFMGYATRQSRVVYLTEQPPGSFRQTLSRAVLLERQDFWALYYHDTIGASWPEIAGAAVAKCAEAGAGLMVVDTLPQFAGIRGDDENSAGEALLAMQPLQEAAGRGLAVIIVRHERKSGGAVGDSGRGSSAFAGAADIVLSLRRAEGGARETVRMIHALSRFSETPATLAIELTPEGYVALGSESALAVTAAKDALLDLAPSVETQGKTLEELLDGAEGVKRTAAQEALRALVEEGLLARCGEGKRGSPYRYWRPGGGELLSAATPSPIAAERKSSEGKGTPSPLGIARTLAMICPAMKTCVCLRWALSKMVCGGKKHEALRDHPAGPGHRRAARLRGREAHHGGEGPAARRPTPGDQVAQGSDHGCPGSAVRYGGVRNAR